MRALIRSAYGAPQEVLGIGDLEVPEPGKGQVLVRVHSAGLDAGAWHLCTGIPKMMRLATGLRAPKQPVVGTEMSGVVEAVGPGVTSFEIGDEVFGFAKGGAYAELAVAKVGKLAKKPAGIDFDSAAVIPVSGQTALEAVRDVARIQANRRVLVTGAGGGVGSYAVQIAKASGATVTGLCSAGKVEFVRSLGADEVVDYNVVDVFDGSRNFQAMIDTAGSRELKTIRKAMDIHSVVAIVGGENDGTWTAGFGRQVVRAPLYSLRSSCKIRPVIADAKTAALDTLAALVVAGDLKVPLTRTIELDEVPIALENFATGATMGKTAVRVAQT